MGRYTSSLFLTHLWFAAESATAAVKMGSITKHGELVAYEAQTSTDGKSEVQLGPDGKALDHEE
jgi:hypothetical protein